MVLPRTLLLSPTCHGVLGLAEAQPGAGCYGPHLVRAGHGLHPVGASWIHHLTLSHPCGPARAGPSDRVWLRCFRCPCRCQPVASCLASAKASGIWAKTILSNYMWSKASGSTWQFCKIILCLEFSIPKLLGFWDQPLQHSTLHIARCFFIFQNIFVPKKKNKSIF